MYPYSPWNRPQDYASIIGQAPPATPAEASWVTPAVIFGGIVAAFAFGVGSALGSGLVAKYVFGSEG